ncbi:lysozyme inhibitor LprI family protein [Pseudomonas sp. N040]|uniref:lysozyme inhibitor LprI family protein n=1 Tax=Pseudomonas sp. N040 TaxID=2785325 RepID=UPI0018A2C96D|nr:lysozyme inhibitor LprI family protein [Pseudomonas sp. N040]MBF7730409.1 DUF1311 domain-containing protein [Pseudomonas sp. N040]MBW7014052.1 DUF1311 domain-containing protein [Pseudomonas sp. N040]
MKNIAPVYPLLLLVSLAASAQTPSEFDALYGKCLDRAGYINNGVVTECSAEVSEKAKSEITRNYKSIYARILAEKPEDAKRFESSQKAWLQYRNTHCDLAGAYIGSPMYAYCPMNLNSARALELRELNGAYPSEDPSSLDDANTLTESKEAIASAELVRKAQEQQVEKDQRYAQEKVEEETRAQERLMADFPKCDSEEAQTEVSSALENAPLGRVAGLSIIKIRDAKQVIGSAASRNCTGTALMNNAEAYPITYRFYLDGDDPMIEAQVHGIDE